MSDKKDKLPEISHLQFAVLDALGAGVKRGKQLREDLAALGIKKTGPAFYQLMARLEDGKFVKGWYEKEIIEGQIIKERHYQILGNGSKAVNELKNFYRGRINLIGVEPAFS